MIAAQPGTPLHHWCKAVSRLKVGEAIRIDRDDLWDIQSYKHNDAVFTPADRILGNIVGSAYTHSYFEDLNGRWVTFVRHPETGQVYHRDPDRR